MTIQEQLSFLLLVKHDIKPVNIPPPNENSLKWTALSSKELENSVYQRAKTREEYLELAAKSILKEKERNMTDWRGESFRARVLAQM